MYDNDIQLVLPKPHKAQQKVLDSKARFKVLCCGRRFGKTLICQVIAIRSMLENKAVCYVAPEFGFGKELFNQVLKLIPNALINENNKSELYIELITGGSLRFLSGEALDSFRGRKYHLVIIDEAAKIKDLETAWNFAIRPTLTDYRGDAIFISTPKGTNFFYKLFIRGKDGEPGYESFHYPTSANPYISKEEIEDAKRDMTEAAFNQEFLALPGENEGNPFKQHDIFNNTIQKLSDKPAVIFGIDLAKTVDFSVIVGLDEDGAMCHFERWRTTHEENRERIKGLPAYIPKVMDSTGVGDPIYEALRDIVPNLHSFKFTGSSKPMIMKSLITNFEKGLVKVNEKTAEEMRTFEYYETEAGNVKYEAQSGYHDDCIMALAMANFYKNKYIDMSKWQLYSM